MNQTHDRLLKNKWKTTKNEWFLIYIYVRMTGTKFYWDILPHNLHPFPTLKWERVRKKKGMIFFVFIQVGMRDIEFRLDAVLPHDLYPPLNPSPNQ